MDLNAGANTVPTVPTPDAGGTPGYFKNQGSGPPWTTISGDWLNGVSVELQTVIEAAGLTLSPSDLGQLLKAIGGAIAAKASATDTTQTSTHYTRALLAAENSQASGADSAAIASIACLVTGDQAASLASESGSATGDQSAIVGTDNCDATGPKAVAIGSDNSNATGEDAAVLAARFSLASGDNALVAASDNCDVSGDTAAAVASEDTNVTANGGHALSCNGSTVSGVRAVLIGAANCELNTPGMVGGGDNSGSGAITPSGLDQGLKWSVSKEGYIVGVRLDISSTATLGGEVILSGLPEYANDAAAGSGGLTSGDVYRTSTGELRIKL